MIKIPFKSVVGIDFLVMKGTRPGEGRFAHRLACGHVITAKRSAGRPKFKRCRQCAYEFLITPPLPNFPPRRQKPLTSHDRAA